MYSCMFEMKNDHRGHLLVKTVNAIKSLIQRYKHTFTNQLQKYCINLNKMLLINVSLLIIIRYQVNAFKLSRTHKYPDSRRFCLLKSLDQFEYTYFAFTVWRLPWRKKTYAHLKKVKWTWKENTKVGNYCS